MAAYSEPTTQEIQDWTGVNLNALELSAQEMVVLLRPLREQARARVALRITLARFNSTDLTDEEVFALTRATALITAAYWLRAPQVRKTTGDHEPLLVEETTDIEMVIQSLLAEADELLTLVAGGSAASTTQDRQYLYNADAPDRVFARNTVW